MPGNTGDIEQWDRYWAYGNIHSFSQVHGGNYPGAVAEFWKSRFQELAEGSRVLDIATGNGAIPLLALEESERLFKHFEISGVDLADIDPANQVTDRSLRAKLSRIFFHGRTPAESLPFDDASVDMACSQFGLEYSNLSRSIPEIARILKPGGRLAVIAHHRDSVLLRATREELDQLDFVLNDVKLYFRARSLLRAMDGVKGGVEGDRANPKLRKKHRMLRDAMDRIRRAAESCTNPHMLLGPARYIEEIFSLAGRVPPGELCKWLDEALLRVTANRRRLLDMMEASRKEDELPGVEKRLRESGLSGIGIQPFHQQDGALLGWRIEACKSK